MPSTRRKSHLNSTADAQRLFVWIIFNVFPLYHVILLEINFVLSIALGPKGGMETGKKIARWRFRGLSCAM